jgi:predicted RND superfamily exporter protein
MTNSIRVIALLGGLILAGSIYWAFGQQAFWGGVDQVMASPWGIVTIVDLYLGFILIALIIFVFERNPITALIWIVPLFFLGNVWSALWFVLRAPLIVSRLRA